MINNMQMTWAAGQGVPTSSPCVDCGLMTGNFCDGAPSVGYDKCFASDRVPEDYPFAVYGGFRTPLCTFCETCSRYCRFCRGVTGCTPPNRSSHWSGVPSSESRSYTAERARLAAAREHALSERIHTGQSLTACEKKTLTEEGLAPVLEALET